MIIIINNNSNNNHYYLNLHVRKSVVRSISATGAFSAGSCFRVAKFRSTSVSE